MGENIRLKIGSIFLFIIVLLAFTNYRVEAKETNLEIKILPEKTDYLNERIEVYVVRDDIFFSDIELNRTNMYTYKTYVEKGRYRFFARVKYDRDNLYQIKLLQDNLDIDYSNLSKLNTVKIDIDNINLEEVDEHISIPKEYIEVPEYTTDDIEELKKIEEEAKEQAQKSVSELEKWERENNFSSKLDSIYKIQTGEKSHYYPDKKDMEYTGDSEEIKQFLEEQRKSDKNGNEVQEEAKQEKEMNNKEGNNKNIVLMIIIIVFVCISSCSFIISRINERKRA